MSKSLRFVWRKISSDSNEEDDVKRLMTGAALLCTLSTPLAAEEVFLICKGSRSTEFNSNKPPLRFDNDTLSMKLDLDKHTFEWTGFDRNYSGKSCGNLKGKDLWEQPCTDVWAPSDLEYKFQSRFPPISSTDGTLNRVTGELYAKSENAEPDAKAYSGYRTESWTTYIMICKNANKQF
jgi:hypothetical protein